MNLKIGSTVLEYGLMLAPMAGFTDYAMRRICHECGAEYSVTEMVSAKATVYGDKKTYKLARITEYEGPVSLQIFGSEPEIMALAAQKLSHPIDGGVAPVAIDINMGCPVPKVFNNGEGSALMKNPSLIYDIVKAVTGATSLPVSVKIRLGIDRAHINSVECALAAEEAGAALITVHGRTRSEMYSGSADIKEIARVKESVKIPLVANGDVTDSASAKRLFSETCADGIMIGRGSIGNPFLFGEIKAALSGAEYPDVDFTKKRDTALRQLAFAIEEKGEAVAVREARKQIALYFKSFCGSAELRARINCSLSYQDVEEAIRLAEKINL